MKTMIDQHRNHPSVVMWVTLNEAARRPPATSAPRRCCSP
ncbi:glycoside hydrolase family 2 TIM barrel-domain containing protein [Streptomyces albidoflavus]